MIKPITKYSINSKLCPTIFKYKDVGSTNSIAKILIKEENFNSIAIVAETQTSGKGQYGNFWESPRGGLWTTLALKPALEISHLSAIPILSAVAIGNVLASYNLKPLLKWPNDILVADNHKKIAGILVEGKITQFALNYILIGIGINVNNTLDQFSVPLREKVTTIFEETKQKNDIFELLEKIIFEIEGCIKTLKQSGKKSILNEWKKMDNILGMQVKVETSEKTFVGKAIDLTKYGELIINTEDNKLHTFSSGILSLIKND
ncbi:MAG: biotin--[acetyl-CoA-carboxylase] ligase [Candidatus Hodarchaeales archaeon]